MHYRTFSGISGLSPSDISNTNLPSHDNQKCLQTLLNLFQEIKLSSTEKQSYPSHHYDLPYELQYCRILLTRLPVFALASFSFPSYFTMQWEVSFSKMQIFSYHCFIKTIQWLPWVLRWYLRSSCGPWGHLWYLWGPCSPSSHIPNGLHSLHSSHTELLPASYVPRLCFVPKFWDLTWLFFLPIMFFSPNSAHNTSLSSRSHLRHHFCRAKPTCQPKLG